MSAFYNSMDFTLLLEVKTGFRDSSNFAGQVPRFTNRINVRLFNTVFILS